MSPGGSGEPQKRLLSAAQGRPLEITPAQGCAGTRETRQSLTDAEAERTRQQGQDRLLLTPPAPGAPPDEQRGLGPDPRAHGNAGSKHGK